MASSVKMTADDGSGGPHGGNTAGAGELWWGVDGCRTGASLDSDATDTGRGPANSGVTYRPARTVARTARTSSPTTGRMRVATATAASTAVTTLRCSIAVRATSS